RHAALLRAYGFQRQPSDRPSRVRTPRGRAAQRAPGSTGHGVLPGAAHAPARHPPARWRARGPTRPRPRQPQLTRTAQPAPSSTPGEPRSELIRALKRGSRLAAGDLDVTGPVLTCSRCANDDSVPAAGADRSEPGLATTRPRTYAREAASSAPVASTVGAVT